MYSCGMHDHSGEWACTTGLPAKSGQNGCISLIVPCTLGIIIFCFVFFFINTHFKIIIIFNICDGKECHGALCPPL